MKRKLFLLGSFVAFIFSAGFSAKAQWVQTNGPFNQIINCLAVKGNNIYAGSDRNGVFLSSDNGANWKNIGFIGESISALIVKDSNLFVSAIRIGFIFVSSDDGKSWQTRNTGIANTIVHCLTLSGTALFAGTSGEGPNTIGGIFRSNDNGLSWTQVFQIYQPYDINVLTANGTFLLAGIRNPVYKNAGVLFTRDKGNNWTNIGLSDQNICSLAVNDTTILAGVDNGWVFRSTDIGTSWNAIKTDSKSTTKVDAIVVDSKTIFAAMFGDGVYRSTDDGLSWTSFNTGLTCSDDRALVEKDSNLFVGTTYGGVWRSGLSGITGVTEKPNKSQLNVSLSPNPSTGIGTLSYHLSFPNRVKIEVYDEVGQMIEKLFDGFEADGDHTEHFDLAEHSAGTYFICLRTDSNMQVRSFIAMR